VRACVGRLDERSMTLLAKRLDGFWAMPEVASEEAEAQPYQLLT
jgi:hypothetical protein